MNTEPGYFIEQIDMNNNEPRYSVNAINSAIVSKLQAEIDRLQARVTELERGIPKEYRSNCTNCGRFVDVGEDVIVDGDQIIKCSKCKNVTHGISIYNPQVTVTYDNRKCVVQTIQLIKDCEPVTHLHLCCVITNEPL